MSTISVRFQTGSKFQNKVFTQPLFYLSENIRQNLYKTFVHKEYNADKVDTNLNVINVNNNINLEMIQVDDWNNVKLS